LRLQAELEYGVRVEGPDSPVARVARRWTKQAEKLRRALSGVRETDVYLQKLAGLRVSVAAPGDRQPHSNRECLRQADELERKLKQLRRASEKRLMTEIESRRGRLDRSSKEMETAFDPLRAPTQAGGARPLLEQFAGLAAEFQELNADSLHEFRKGIKKVRYLAEYLAPADPLAGRLAAGLRRMQSAIGEWHDWQAMGKAAKRALKGHPYENSLAELLETLAGESLEKALDLCRRATDRLLKQADRSGAASEPVLEKIPVRSAGGVVAADERKYA
jgi:CHAD domain-containing protein